LTGDCFSRGVLWVFLLACGHPLKHSRETIQEKSITEFARSALAGREGREFCLSNDMLISFILPDFQGKTLPSTSEIH
jgi:hypothetical protein